MRLLFCSLVLLPLLTLPARAENWPTWRGPHGNGYCDEKDVPLRWSATENVHWKVPLPDQGNSSPVVWGERIFLSQASEKTLWPPKGGANAGKASARRRSLLCLSRADGKLLWQKDVIHDEPEMTHGTNPFDSATPAVDGERVVVSHGSAGLYCYDLAGKELWKKEVGKLEHIWGNASSPIFYQNLVILWCGPGETQYLLAVDKATGQQVWRYDEPGGKSGTKGSGEWSGCWATPIIAPVAGHDELILPLPKHVKAFDPKTGQELWSCSGMGPLAYASPAISPDGIVVAFSGFHGAALAVRAGGKGDVTKTHRLWHQTAKNPQRIGSPVIVGDYCYMPGEDVVQCLEVKTGKDVWDRQRLNGKTWSSFTLIGDKLLLPDMAGAVHVLDASPTFREVGRNAVGDEVTRASLAVADGELFLRTYNHLWCISQKK